MTYPVSAFFDNPEKSGASLSPDGTLLAYLADEGGRLNVWVEPVDGGEAVCVTHDHNRNVSKLLWTADPQTLLYLQDDDGDENLHVFRVDLSDPSAPAVDLTPYPGARAELVLLASDPALGLVALNLRDPDRMDVHRIDLRTGALELVIENPGHVDGWVLGATGDAFAWTRASSTTETLSRWTDDGLVELLTLDVATNPLRTLLVVTPDGTGIWYASNRDSEHTQLVHLDIATGEETVIAAVDGISVDETGFLSSAVPPALIIDKATGDLLAVRFLGERQVIVVVDPRVQPVLDAVQGLHEGDLGQLSSDAAGRRWIVTFLHDTDPDVTYLYDHTTGESQLLFRPFGRLDPSLLAPMASVSVTSRDGWTLPSFLTLPVGVEPSGLPLVLFVHGGPWFRDRWGWNARVQALAHAGYAVLQVNMRGSTGYGKAFTAAAVGEWAGAMHDDLIDGVEWAVKQGIADPTRVAIFGGSYGGYSALVGATFTPEVFAAAIDFCGISRLPDFMDALPVYLKHYLAWELFIGSPAEAAARSPLSRIDAVSRPLMVIHGSQDTRVLQEESDVVVSALQARGADVEYLLEAKEGHGFVNPENNTALFERVLAFLDRTIGR